MFCATVGGEQDFLVDEHDAAVFGIHGPGKDNRPVVDEDLAARRRLVAGEDLHQGRLARTVLADDGMHLARPHGQRHVVQHLDRTEALGKAPRGKDRGCARNRIAGHRGPPSAADDGPAVRSLANPSRAGKNLA